MGHRGRAGCSGALAGAVSQGESLRRPGGLRILPALDAGSLPLRAGQGRAGCRCRVRRHRKLIVCAPPDHGRDGLDPVEFLHSPGSNSQERRPE
jgi:hypothetical protein